MLNIYGIFKGSKWTMCTNKRKALRAVKAGGQVRVMSYSGAANSWDMPTFYICSTHLVTVYVRCGAD